MGEKYKIQIHPRNGDFDHNSIKLLDDLKTFPEADFCAEWMDDSVTSWMHLNDPKRSRDEEIRLPFGTRKEQWSN